MTFTSVVKVSKKVCLVILLQVQTSRHLQMASQSPRTDLYASLIALFFPPNRVTIDVLVPPFILASSLSMRPFSFEHRAATESNLPLLKTSAAGPVPVQTILSSHLEQNEHMASKTIFSIVRRFSRSFACNVLYFVFCCSWSLSWSMFDFFLYLRTGQDRTGQDRTGEAGQDMKQDR